MTFLWAKYIPHDQREAYERAGWTVEDSLKGTHHGFHSLVGRWQGDGSPPKPVGLSSEAVEPVGQ